MNSCGVCEKKALLKTCGRCKIVQYCGKECQSSDWKSHKMSCNITLSLFDKYNIGKKLGDKIIFCSWSKVISGTEEYPEGQYFLHRNSIEIIPIDTNTKFGGIYNRQLNLIVLDIVMQSGLILSKITDCKDGERVICNLILQDKSEVFEEVDICTSLLGNKFSNHKYKRHFEVNAINIRKL